MKRKNAAKIFVILLSLILTLCLALSGCQKKIEVVYDGDKLDPEQIEVPGNNTTMPQLPPPPSAVPVSNPENTPSMVSCYASNDGYTVEEKLSGDIWITYGQDGKELADWAYVFIEIADYSPAYPNFKLKYYSQGVESITVQAVYYEQYEQNYPAVTVLLENGLQDVGEDEEPGIVAASFKDTLILDSNYNFVSGSFLKDKAILGFMIFIDSNPKLSHTDRQGTLIIKSVGPVNDADPDLIVLNSPPKLSGWTASFFSQMDLEQSEAQGDKRTKNAKLTYTAPALSWSVLTGTITGYKSEYSCVSMKIKGTNVKSISIAIDYAGGTTPYKDAWLVYGASLADGVVETFDFDFTNLEETANATHDQTISGSYVRFLKPTSISIYIDNNLENENSGVIEVMDVTFYTPVTEGAPRIGTWTVPSGVTKSNVNDGGYATLTYDRSLGWNNITVNVSNYKEEYKVIEIKVKFYGCLNLGMALAYSGGNTVILQSSGQDTPGVVKQIQSQQGSDSLGEFVMHTITLDFSDCPAGPMRLWQRPITSILIYIDALDEEGNYVAPGQSIEPARIMQFAGITFKTKD